MVGDWSRKQVGDGRLRTQSHSDFVMVANGASSLTFLAVK